MIIDIKIKISQNMSYFFDKQHKYGPFKGILLIITLTTVLFFSFYYLFIPISLRSKAHNASKKLHSQYIQAEMHSLCTKIKYNEANKNGQITLENLSPSNEKRQYNITLCQGSEFISKVEVSDTFYKKKNTDEVYLLKKNGDTLKTKIPFCYLLE